MSAPAKPIPGVEIRERHRRNGEVYYVYRVRFRNALGKRAQRTFDSAQDALDFRARLRLLKRAGNLGVLECGNEALERFVVDFWRLYAETRLEPSTQRKYRCLWNAHIHKRLGAMELRQITPLVLSQFTGELEHTGASAATIRSCLGMLQSMFARAIEWDRASVNVVKLIAKPRAPRRRAIQPLSPAVVEALRRQMLRNPNHGLRDAALVSVLAYAGLRPEEALALEYRHVRERTILIEQKWVDGKIAPGQKTRRPPRCPPLLDALRVDLRELQLACGKPAGLIFTRPDGKPWRDHNWREWRSRVWQPACAAIGIATITKTANVSDGKRKTRRTYQGPVPYDLRHSFASLLVHEGRYSIVQISEWMGHSTATLLGHYAHLISDLANKPSLPNGQAIKAARRTRVLGTQSSQIVPAGNNVITHWHYSYDGR
jgi:integrase